MGACTSSHHCPHLEVVNHTIARRLPAAKTRNPLPHCPETPSNTKSRTFALLAGTWFPPYWRSMVELRRVRIVYHMSGESPTPWLAAPNSLRPPTPCHKLDTITWRSCACGAGRTWFPLYPRAPGVPPTSLHHQAHRLESPTYWPAAHSSPTPPTP